MDGSTGRFPSWDGLSRWRRWPFASTSSSPWTVIPIPSATRFMASFPLWCRAVSCGIGWPQKPAPPGGGAGRRESRKAGRRKGKNAGRRERRNAKRGTVPVGWVGGGTVPFSRAETREGGTAGRRDGIEAVKGSRFQVPSWGKEAGRSAPAFILLNSSFILGGWMRESGTE